MQRTKESRPSKSVLLAFARQKISVPVYVLVLFPFIFIIFAAVFSASISAQSSFLSQLHTPSEFGTNRQSFNVATEAPAVVENGTEVENTASLVNENALLKLTAITSVPKCAKKGPAKSFIILFMGHSGSTAMITALQQHSQIAVQGYEPLDHGRRGANTSEALKFADNFFTQALKRQQIGGFKLRPHHILQEPRKWAALFRKHDTRILWNYRGNVFKQAVGHYPIRFLNDSSRYEGLSVSPARKETRDRVSRFRIHDMNALHILLDDRLRGEAHVEVALAMAAPGRCVLPLSYEGYLKDSKLATLRMQAFLGISLDEELVAMRKKATNDNLCQVVENWDEVCNAFYGCHQWRNMMEDIENGCTCKQLNIRSGDKWHGHCFQSSQKKAYSGINFSRTRRSSL